MKMILFSAYLSFIIYSLQSCINQDGTTVISDGPFLGCKLPGNEPELFAPGIVTGGYMTRDIAISPDGNEIYFGTRISKYYTILVTRRGERGWSRPEVMQHMEDPEYMNIEPALSYDGDKFYFLSNRPMSGNEPGGQDIWVMDRLGDGWGEPCNLGLPVNTDLPEFYPSLTMDGTIYFTRNETGSQTSYIYRSRMVDGLLQEPERLPEQVNCGQNHYNAFVAHDESYIIVPVVGRDDSFGGTDYYIVFRDQDDNWSEPQNMGNKINTEDGLEYSAYVTRDSRYIFFMSRRFMDLGSENLTFNLLQGLYNQPESGNPSIYWMEASIIDSLRGKAVFNDR
ncbi:MAG TPA: hypothetical protein VMW76_00875 [Bacteroidales bacterium]|nr:hypothetical protein [Bacteroidales bacterium]